MDWIGENDIDQAKILGLTPALQGIQRSYEKISRYTNYPEREIDIDLAGRWSESIQDAIHSLEAGGKQRLVLMPGAQPLEGKSIRQYKNEDGYTFHLCDEVEVDAGSPLELNYAAFHNVPQADSKHIFPYDVRRDISEMLYMGDKYRGIVVPVTTLSRAITQEAHERSFALVPLDPQMEMFKQSIAALPGGGTMEFTRFEDIMASTQKLSSLHFNALINMYETERSVKADSIMPSKVIFESDDSAHLLFSSYENQQTSRDVHKRVAQLGLEMTDIGRPTDIEEWPWIHIRIDPSTDDYAEVNQISPTTISKWEVVVGQPMPGLNTGKVQRLEVNYEAPIIWD